MPLELTVKLAWAHKSYAVAPASTYGRVQHEVDRVDAVERHDRRGRMQDRSDGRDIGQGVVGVLGDHRVIARAGVGRSHQRVAGIGGSGNRIGIVVIPLVGDGRRGQKPTP